MKFLIYFLSCFYKNRSSDQLCARVTSEKQLKKENNYVLFERGKEGFSLLWFTEMYQSVVRRIIFKMLFSAKALTLLLQCRVHSSFRGFWNSQHSDVNFRYEVSGTVLSLIKSYLLLWVNRTLIALRNQSVNHLIPAKMFGKNVGRNIPHALPGFLPKQSTIWSLGTPDKDEWCELSKKFTAILLFHLKCRIVLSRLECLVARYCKSLWCAGNAQDVWQGYLRENNDTYSDFYIMERI